MWFKFALPSNRSVAVQTWTWIDMTRTEKPWPKFLGFFLSPFVSGYRWTAGLEAAACCSASTGLSFVSFSWPTIIISFCVLEPGAGYLQPTPQGFNSSFPLAAARIHMLHQQQPLVDFSTLTFLLQIFVFVLLPAAPYFPKYFPPSLLANNY